MRRLFITFLALISAFAMYMTISSHKAREPDFSLKSPCFDNADRYYTREVYR